MRRTIETSRTWGRIVVAVGLLALALLAGRGMTDEASTAAPKPVPAPELAGITDWINSPGFTLADKQGKVVVLHFWTFGCINCQRNLPHYNRWQKDLAEDGVQILGIHTPELDHEQNVDTVKAQVKKLKIAYPVAVDNNRETWQAYENRWWPSIYLIDKKGLVRYRWDGELEFKNAGGDKIVRAKIKQLLAE